MPSKTEVIAALSVLAHPVRLDVFRALVQAGHGGVTPTFLAELVEPQLKQSTLATYLKELTSAGLVVNEREGRNAIYRASFDRMNAVLGYLMQNCCQGVPQAAQASSDSCAC